MDRIDQIFACLAASPFRQRFHLRQKDRSYLERKGHALVIEHARTFIAERLAPARPINDGKQTPMRGHPVFVAQHATATCCRGCLETWHGIARNHPLTAPEQDHVVAVIGRWLDEETARHPHATVQTTLDLGPKPPKASARRKPVNPNRCAATRDMFDEA